MPQPRTPLVRNLLKRWGVPLICNAPELVQVTVKELIPLTPMTGSPNVMKEWGYFQAQKTGSKYLGSTRDVTLTIRFERANPNVNLEIPIWLNADGVAVVDENVAPLDFVQRTQDVIKYKPEGGVDESFTFIGVVTPINAKVLAELRGLDISGDFTVKSTLKTFKLNDTITFEGDLYKVSHVLPLAHYTRLTMVKA